MYQLAQAYLVSYNCNKNASRIFFFFLRIRPKIKHPFYN